MALYMHESQCLRRLHATRMRKEPSQTQLPRGPSTAMVHRCLHLCKRLHTPESHRHFDIRIQSSWGSGPNNSNAAETSINSRWWSGGRDSDSPNSQERLQDSDSSSSTSTQGRFGSLFSGKESSSTHSNGSSSSYSYGSSASHGSHGGSVAEPAGAWVLVALVPTMVWCVTWCLTGGMVTLTNSCMAGMTSIAQLLFPSLPVRGVDYEDIAASLVKSLHTNTDHPGTWTRPGLWAPAWLMRGCMVAMFNLATASSNVASSLIPVPQWLAASSISQNSMYLICLLLMLPVGAGISTLARQMAVLTQRYRLSLPSLKLPGLSTNFPRFSDNTALALKLSGLLAWPCISAAAVLQPLLSTHSTSTPSFPIAASQVAVCTLALLLLLTAAALAGRFVFRLSRQAAGTDAVQVFGFQVGLVCAAQLVLNVTQMGLGMAGGQLAVQQLVMPVLSTLILGRIAWSTWRLFRIGSATPSMWLQLLTLAPVVRAPEAAAGSS